MKKSFAENWRGLCHVIELNQGTCECKVFKCAMCNMGVIVQNASALIIAPPSGPHALLLVCQVYGTL